jgi:hypothetical protein
MRAKRPGANGNRGEMTQGAKRPGTPTLGLEGTGSARPPTLALAPEGSGILEETNMVWLLTDTSKGLGTDPSQKQSRPVILTAS